MFKEYSRFYNLAHAKKNYKKEAEFVYHWANKPTSLIDFGCGTGQHIKYWAPKMEFILGVDASPQMLELAPQYDNVLYYNQVGLKNGELYCEQLDCATALFNVVGYYHLKNLLPNIPLKKGGYFIFDCWVKDKTKPTISVRWLDKDTLRVVLPIHYKNPALTLKIWVFTPQREPIWETHTIHLYTEKEIRQLCKRYGYRVSGVKRGKGWNWWYKLRKL